MILHPLERRVLKTIQQHALIPESSTVVVAVSGGVDSMALMHILHALAPRLGCTLHIATIDHMLRGEESATDAQFVADEAAKLGLACSLRRKDVAAYMQRQKERWKNNPSTEMAARFLRYRELNFVAHLQKAGYVATGHHLDDQAETVLMRFISGTSLRGLAAMQFEDELPYGAHDLRLIRPLLNVTRADINEYVTQHNIASSVDSSNADTSYKRNVVRQEVMPLLRRLNPQVDRALAQLSEQAALETAFFDRQLESAIKAVITNVPSAANMHTDHMSPSHMKLNRAAFRVLDPALQRRLVTWAYAENRHPMQHLRGGLTHQHILNCVDAITHGQVGKRINLPHGVYLRIGYEYALLEDVQHPAQTPLYALARIAKADETLSTEAGNFVAHADWLVIARRSEAEITAFRPDPYHRVGSQPRATAELLVPRAAALALRGRRNGDRFAPPGLDGHTQKIKQWMIDRKIPAALRDRIPLVDVDGKVAAIFWEDNWTVAAPFRAHREPNEDEQRIFISLYA